MAITYKKPSKEFEKMIGVKTNKRDARASIGRDENVLEYYFLEVEKLIPYPGQVRQDFGSEEDFQGLVDSIKTYGIRRPLTIKKTDGDLFHIISGERRYKAAKESGLKKVPCIILKDNIDEEEISIVENLYSKDLNPIEFAKALGFLSDGIKKRTQEEISKIVGLSRPKVSAYLSFLNIDSEIVSYLKQHNLLTFRGLEAAKRFETLDAYLASKQKLKGKKPIKLLEVSFGGDKIEVNFKNLKKLSSEESRKVLDDLKKQIASIEREIF